AATFLERNAALEGTLRHERFFTNLIQSALSEGFLAAVLCELGRFDAAIGHAEAAVRIAEAVDHPNTLIAGLFFLGSVHLHLGDLPRATQFLERNLDHSRTLQEVLRGPLAAAALGAAYALEQRSGDLAARRPVLPIYTQ